MRHQMRLTPEPFEMVRSGKKTIELRLLDEKRRAVRVGDQIEFTNQRDKSRACLVRVTALHPFPSFAELYAALPLEKCGYTARTAQSARPSDMDAYYSREEQERYGVVGIEIELLDPDAGGLTRTSRFLSRVLRHRPGDAGITLDRHGWADVNALIAGVSKKMPLTRETLEKIVRTDDKGRYSFSPDGTKIRANQGHSVPVEVEMDELPPPAVLWHGTGEKYTESIERNGLVAKGRLYVHLSSDPETAAAVGGRHGRPVVYRVDTGRMAADGFRFFRSANRVWLTWYVPACYLTREE